MASKIDHAAIITATGARDITGAHARLSFLGYTTACNRCHGTGHHSRNCHGQTHCYSCMGRGVVITTMTAKSLAEVASRVAAGNLAPYFVRNAAIKAARLAVKPAAEKFQDDFRPAGGIIQSFSNAVDASHAAKAILSSLGVDTYRAEIDLETCAPELWRAHRFMSVLSNAVMDADVHVHVHGRDAEEKLEIIRQCTELAAQANAAWIEMVQENA